MENIFRVLILTLIAFTLACAGSNQTAVKNTSQNSSIYPAWYGSFEFSSDSSSFISRATAVAGDSETAKTRAEKEARVTLESHIAKELEDIRTELERDGSEIVTKSDFILMLRNAHAKIEQEALVINTESNEKEDIFRGFAKVEITKQQVKTLIEEGFSSKTAYRMEFLNSQSFKEFIGE